MNQKAEEQSNSILKKTSLEIKQGRSDYSILPVELDGSIIPFEVKKTYFVLGGENESQSGKHAHYDEKEFFLVLKGKAKLVSLDENNEEYEMELGEADGVYIPNMIWHGFSYLSKNCVIIAYSSEHYKEDRSDYIEEKNIFINIKK